MSTNSPLGTLLQLIRQQTDFSARKLGKVSLQHREAEEKLNLLLRYRHSYQSDLQNSIEYGVSHMEWLNSIAFLSKLDTAITEQSQAVSYTHSKRITASNEFLSCQRKLKSYEILSQRRQNSEDLRQIRYELKLQDEFNSNAFSRKSFSENSHY